MPLKGHESDKLNMQGDPPVSVPNRIKQLFRILKILHHFHWHPGRWNYPEFIYPPWNSMASFPLKNGAWEVTILSFLGLSAYFHRLLLLVLGRIYLPQKSDFPHIIILHLQLTCIKSPISPITKSKTTCYVCMPCLIHVFTQNFKKSTTQTFCTHVFHPGCDIRGAIWSYWGDLFP